MVLPPRDPPMTAGALVLGRTECMSVLRRGNVGRLGFVGDEWSQESPMASTTPLRCTSHARLARGEARYTSSARPASGRAGSRVDQPKLLAAT